VVEKVKSLEAKKFRKLFKNIDMKTRIIILIAVCAILTLSFTFVVVKKPASNGNATTYSETDAPVGGLASEEIR
jgi:hypothetical protein